MVLWREKRRIYNLKEIRKREKIITNKIMCRKCGDIIESTYQHDFKMCECGSCAVDGGHAYLRRCFKNRDDIIEMSEVILVDDESQGEK